MIQEVPNRFLTRLVVIAGLLILGWMAALRLPLDFLPSLSFPELRVDLVLGEVGNRDDLTRRWIVPLESAIRASGRVRGILGEVHPRGAQFRVPLEPGTDAERKAARLESELSALRRRLPPGSWLGVGPAGESTGDRALVVWLQGDPTAPVDPGLVQALEALPEIRSVTVTGEGRRELRVKPRATFTSPHRLRQTLDRWLSVRRLGSVEVGGRRLPVLEAAKTEGPVASLPVAQGERALPLGAVADIVWRQEEPGWLAHVAGTPGRVLFVERELNASPLALERSLRRVLREFGLRENSRVLLSEADPLRQLLVRLLVGALVAGFGMGALVASLVGWRSGLVQLLALPVALAASLNAFWLSNLPLDVTTLPALWVALAASLTFLGLRQAGRRGGETARVGLEVALAGFLLPVAVALVGGRLAPFLAAPAKAFALALGASILALTLLPLSRPRDVPPRWLASVLGLVLRNPWTVLLAAVTLVYALLVVCGRALAPFPSSLSPSQGDLVVQLRFAEGTTLDGARQRVEAIESHLHGLDEVEDHWSVYSSDWGAVQVSVSPGKRQVSQLRPFAARLRYQLSQVPAAVQVVPLADAGSAQERTFNFSDELEERPETDEDVTFYRFILHAGEAAALSRARDQVVERLSHIGGANPRYRITAADIQSDWGRPTTRIELAAKPGVGPHTAARAADAIRRRSTLPGSRLLPGGRDLTLRVLGIDSPTEPDEVPQRSEATGIQHLDGAGSRRHPPADPTSAAALPQSAAIVPDAVLQAQEVVAPPPIQRQMGRFVLPLTVTLPYNLAAPQLRLQIDRVLAQIPLPPGVELRRPELDPGFWRPERRRMLAVAACLPVLLLALAICRLNSCLAGLFSQAPLVLGVAASTPFILATLGKADEMTYLGLAAVLCAALPLSLEVTAAMTHSPTTPLAGGMAYRWLARRGGWTGVTTAGWILLLAAPGLGLEAARHPWVLPLRVGAVAGGAACLGAFLVLPGLLRALSLAVHRDPEEVRRRAHPPVWREEGELELSARSLTKVYGDGHVALRGVNFRLQPGIIGLLGPNGAGKTTLLRLLCGLLEPTRGQVGFRGVPLSAHNLAEYRRRVGFLPQDSNAYEGLSGEKFLDYWALVRGLKDPRQRRREVTRVLTQVGLLEAAQRKVRQYSGGMRRRIGIARALLGSPPILIVDEPTTGLDVESRNHLRETLLAAAGERIVLFSTHIASDVAAAATRILLLHQGRLLFDGTAGELIELARGRVFEAVVKDDELRELSHRYRVTTRVRTLDGIRIRAVARRGQEPGGEPAEPNLEEAYLARIGEEEGQRQRALWLERSLLDLGAH